MPHVTPIEGILDERHAAARDAYSRRDIAAYRDIFSPNLEYQQLNGRVIGRDRLMRDVEAQLRGLSKVGSRFVREELILQGDQASEILSQYDGAEMTAFGFVRRAWSVRRRARFNWVISGGVWMIAQVHVLSEDMRHEGWRFGR